MKPRFSGLLIEASRTGWSLPPTNERKEFVCLAGGSLGLFGLSDGPGHTDIRARYAWSLPDCRHILAGSSFILLLLSLQDSRVICPLVPKLRLLF